MGPIALESYGVPAVVAVSKLFKELLEIARGAKPPSIEPPLEKNFVDDLLGRVFRAASGGSKESGEPERSQGQRYAVIETAVRDLFYHLIGASDYPQLWNLLDILSILGDSEQCDPALLFWLVEELLDSQTIAGCRTVFDYLESRRERITAKHFKQKNLVILRSCNELLRRLSRAEDAAFCGRVFIFMFQSFPLGDKSSVNLRGEFHVENVTTFDDGPSTEDDGKMDVDNEGGLDPKTGAKAVSFDAKDAADNDKALNAEALYPLFWALQTNFSQPKTLLNKDGFTQFKSGLEATMTAFKSIQNGQGSRSTKVSEETKRVAKEKRDGGGDDGTTPFNAKYLTSKDLFRLEMSDLSFRRHILVQALIVIDFLLSLSPKAKEKATSISNPNKSVMFSSQVLSEDDTKWVVDMKRIIADYLKQGAEGPYFFRMVETVLSRDKNWVRWKMESCPSIAKPPVSPEVFAEAKKTVLKTTTNKRLRPIPLGSLDLDFLRPDAAHNQWDSYKNPDRYKLPDLDSFKRKIADDDFEIEMASSSQAKQAAMERKACDTWKAMRLARRFKPLSAFEKIDDDDNISALFEDTPKDSKANGTADDDEEMSGTPPSDARPVVLVGPVGVGKSALTALLKSRQPGVFRTVVRHTTKRRGDDDVNGRDFHFVDKEKFNMMVDGDQMVEFSEADGVSFGTSHSAVRAISEAGRVPVLHLDHTAAEFAKDMGFSARFIAILPESVEGLMSRLKSAGTMDEEVESAVRAAEAFMEATKTAGFYEKIIVNKDEAETLQALEQHLYDGVQEVDMVNGGAE